ncbi:MAG: sugar phosphate isomerase/epimerase family protein [Clostridia bacterium]
MKRGFLSAIVPDMTFREVMEFAAELHMDCVEVACWPVSAANRRYSGVTHIDVANLDEKQIDEIRQTCRDTGITISAIAYYPNTLDPDPDKRAFYISHLKKCIDAAKMLGVNQVNSFIGKVKDLSVNANFEIYKEVWPNIVAYAAVRGVRIAIENCPMYYTIDEFPGGTNLASTPEIWRRMFAIIPDANFGLNYDPSHLIWQLIDYVKPLYEFKERIFHVHFKDVKIDHERLSDAGIYAYPATYQTPKLPGLGDIDFRAFVCGLYDIHYDGCAVIEVEDRAFEATLESRKDAIRLSHRYLDQYLV